MVRASMLLLVGLVLGSCSSLRQQSLLDESVNTSADEIAACRLGDAAVFLRIDARGTEQLLQTTRRDDGSWSIPEPATLCAPALQARAGKPTIARMREGTLLLVFPAHRTPTNVDLAESIFDGQQWSPPQWLDQLNSPTWDSQPSLSPDGSLLVFCSDRAGGRGGKDLYLSSRTPDGWSKPVLLPFCSSGDEFTPALLADSSILFARRRNITSGDFDLYRAQHATSLQWQDPSPLPPPINSTADDIAPVFWDDHVLFSSNRNGDFDLQWMPLCGPVLLEIRIDRSATVERPSGIATIASTDGIQTVPIGANGRCSVQLQPTVRYLVRYTNSCTNWSNQWEVTAPCDPQHTVVLELAASLPNDGAVWEAIAEQAFFPEDYLPATDAHRTATALLARYNLDGAVAGLPASFDERSIAELVAHVASIFTCAPSAELEITIAASPTERPIRYNGTTLSLPTESGPLVLESGMLLSPTSAGFLRAYAVQRRLQEAMAANTVLSSRLDQLRWRLSTDLDIPNAVRYRISVVH
jgi:hypothetical protein